MKLNTSTSGTSCQLEDISSNGNHITVTENGTYTTGIDLEHDYQFDMPHEPKHYDMSQPRKGYASPCENCPNNPMINKFSSGVCNCVLPYMDILY